MVAPFAGLTVVFNILFGHYLLNEDICKTDIIGSIIITMYSYNYIIYIEAVL